MKSSNIFKGLVFLAQIFQNNSLQIPSTNHIRHANFLPRDLITNSGLNNCLKINWRGQLETIAAKPLGFLPWTSSNHLLTIGHAGVTHRQWERIETNYLATLKRSSLAIHWPFHLETGGQGEEQILEFCPHQAALWCWAQRNSVRTHTQASPWEVAERDGVWRLPPFNVPQTLQFPGTEEDSH